MTVAIIEAFDSEDFNPLDRIERIAEAYEWSFDRTNLSEVTMQIEGAWTDLTVSLTWRDEYEMLHVAAGFGLKVPAARREETARLAARINEQLLTGHFDLWHDDGSLVFRNSLLLSGGAEANDAQCEDLIRFAVESCERYFPAVQFVAWAGRSAEDALESSLLETMGEA
jgi:hypothetical protein